MASEEAQARFRELVLREFASEFKMGFFLSYFRNFAIPGIAGVLASTGEIERRPAKRSFDTAIIIYELIADGVDGARGKAMVEILRRAHQGVPGSKDNYLYVLLTMLVVPFDYIAHFGRRGLTSDEKAAGLGFFTLLGDRMGVPVPFDSYEAAEAFFRSYESEHVAASPEGRRLFRATVGLYEARLPRLARPLALVGLAAMFNDPGLSRALGLPTPGRMVSILLVGVLRTSSWLARRNIEPAFTPGKSGSHVYPDGYSLADLGPQHGTGIR